MLSYANGHEKWLKLLGALCAIVHGAGMPILAIAFGGMTDIFLEAQQRTENMGEMSPDNTPFEGQFAGGFSSKVLKFCMYYVYLGFIVLVASYGQIACWEVACERRVHKIRKAYFKSMLRQEISWYDLHQSGEMTYRLTDDLERVREGTGDKVSLFIQTVSGFTAGFVVGFIYSWKLTLVMMTIAPFLIVMGGAVAVFLANRTKEEQEMYAVAGAVAEETFSSIRTVLALNGQKRQLSRYDAALEDGIKSGNPKINCMAICSCFSYCLMFFSYGLAFWYGATLMLDDPSLSRGSMFTVFMAIIIGSHSLANAVPHLSAIAVATGAGKVISDCIENVPIIDPYCESGLQPTDIKGRIEFKYVHFAYPSRKDVKVLKGINFKVKEGEKVALVGASGCSKSTIINLLLRYYDADKGKILIDGNDICDLNVKFLRNMVGVVSQEPILFDGSLEENIRLGNPNATPEEIREATKLANAYNFITLFPRGLDTRVGECGIQLSGGQKQRIAIARALVRNPKILLLDEATSALDTESETAVQKALDQAKEGRTTIMVAHRLSTIRDSDKIFVLSHGNIVEGGTHEELMDRKGLFYKMVMAQQLDSAICGEAAEVELDGTEREKVKIQRDTKDADYLTVTRDLIRLEKEVQKKTISSPSSVKLLFANRKSFSLIIGGLFGTLMCGIVWPIFALLYSQIFQVYSEQGIELKSDAMFWSWMFVILGLGYGTGAIIGVMLLCRAGDNITKSMRTDAFANLLCQDAGYFDDEAHNTGKLCLRFATDAPSVRYVFTRLPWIISNFITIICGIGIACITGWKMAVVVVLMVPLIVGSAYVEFRMRFGKQMRDAKLLEEAGKISAEAVENIRTVQALTREDWFFERYANSLEQPFRQNLSLAHVYGITFGFSRSVIFFVYAISFYYGATLVSSGEMTSLDVYRVFFAISICAIAFGQSSSFIPDIAQARLSAGLFFNMIEQKPSIDSCSTAGLKPEVEGYIQLKNIHFSYPTRPTAEVLRGLNITVAPGQTLAIVGPSGCGKSTVVSLLQRFYDVTRGEITFDGYNLKTLNLQHLRNQIGLVSQEPVLFNCTIKENICYGVEEEVTHEDIFWAAKLANIHQFIISLPTGYNTNVGEKGIQLSGGQKQRIAIARALVRNPKILLLDEATSALDTESEKIVQEALDNARQGRTCIIIAHRLSTIQNADSIAVICEGKVVEQGTHQQLLENNRVYSTLCQMQRLMEE